MSLSISISRTSLSLSALVLSGNADAAELGVVDYQEPARQARIAYAPDSPHIHGSQPLSWAWQQTFLQFGVVTDHSATEAESKALVEELITAITQWSYLVTVTVGGAQQIWTCQPGSLAPTGSRTYADITDHNPTWAVSIPCHPVPS